MRYAIATLGCKVNQYDSAIIESRLRARGFDRCEFDEPADVYLVNTCTVTDRADAESLKLARRARRLDPRRIIEALDELRARGFKEVTLSGVHLGGYGKDLDPPVELADLLEMIAERSPIDRVRISSLDPEELSDRIIDVIANGSVFCP